MRELIRIVEEPRECPYLPEENATLEVRLVTDVSPAEYSDLMARGYRRFGMQIFRPVCAGCEECRSMRVLVRQFTPTRSHLRILRQNRHIRAELHPAFATPEHIGVFNEYHRFMHLHRGWPPQRVTLDSYYQDFVAGGSDSAKQWLYFDGEKLVGVALMDEVPGAISLVYCFYDPAWRAQSPGTFSILNQLNYARLGGLEYAYFGYRVEGCQSLNYKSRFRPHEILCGLPEEHNPPVWIAAPPEKSAKSGAPREISGVIAP
jgi:arginyl-tRNA--protein-N-Asp/Glu arginylyltransferase